MKKIISRLLILCFLLCGCAPEAPVMSITDPPPETAVPQGLYQTGSHLEISSLGAVKIYPLGSRTGKAILPFGEDLLLLSAGEETALTLLTGDTLVPSYVKSLRFSLDADSCFISGDTLSYYDPIRCQTVVLNTQLEEVRTIDAPKDLIGSPVLSPDGVTLYYCTAGSIRAWDLENQQNRILRETAVSPQTVQALLLSGQVLRCRMADGSSLFLSAQTGELFQRWDGKLKVSVGADQYIAASWETNLWSLVFDPFGGPAQALTPRELSAQYFLLEGSNGVVTAALSGEVATLDYYDLSTGRRTASQMFRGTIPLSLVSRGEDALWGLTILAECQGQAIFRWSFQDTPATDSRIYTGPHFTAENPDRQGLAQCQDYASKIGAQYGLDIAVWQDAASAAPKGISLEPEYRVNILNRELELLDHRLSQFPPGLLAATAADFSGFQICLVSRISGSATGDEGLQFFLGDRAFLVLVAGSTSEEALYHELFHVMETHILSRSSAFDQWSALNPQGFQYDYNYQTNAIRDSGIYLTEKNRAFIDTFSMSYPKEDRAQIFKHAMGKDQGHLFQTKAMQKKLAAVCAGIRQAYNLPEEEAYPWEQYLK